MAYKFGTEETVRQATVRSAREQLDRAVSELSEGLGDDPVKAIHAARKAIKKERSLLRLTRGSISGSQRQSANATLRQAARALSGARDADVMIASLDGLHDRFAGQIPATTFEAIREHLEAERANTSEHRAGSALDAQAVQDLGSMRVRVDEWELRKGGWKALDTGLIRSYKRGRRGLERARDGAETADLHEWRKRVKDLWYHERLLAPICGPAVRGHAKELDRLAGLLGDDHDLALLTEQLTMNAMPVAADVDSVLTLIAHRRQELQVEAFRLGARVYAESPKAYLRRMRTSWKAGRALARAPHEQLLNHAVT